MEEGKYVFKKPGHLWGVTGPNSVKGPTPEEGEVGRWEGYMENVPLKSPSTEKVLG
jgi:hypothetical protein